LNERLENWMRKFAARAVAYVTSLVGDRDEAEDIVQDTFYNLLTHYSERKLLEEGERILFRSLTNASINAIKRARKTVSLNATDENELAPVQTVPQKRYPDPVLSAERNELKQAIDEAMAKLPVAQRAALHLRIIGYSLADISDMLGVTPSNAGVLIHRARLALKQRLKKFIE